MLAKQSLRTFSTRMWRSRCSRNLLCFLMDILSLESMHGQNKIEFLSWEGWLGGAVVRVATSTKAIEI
eukprot:38165-Amphidinium_carterae.2